VFYCIIFTIFAVTAVTTGFYLRGERFAEQYRYTRDNLYDTIEEFEDFQAETADEHARLVEESMYIYEQLTEEQRMARIEQNLLRQQQQSALNDLQDQINDLEQMIIEFDEERQSIIEGLSTRVIIPAVSTLFDLLIDSQAALLYYSRLWDMVPTIVEYEHTEVALMAFSVNATDDTEAMPLTEADLTERLNQLVFELELQVLLLEDLQSYRQQMDPHLRNFPTLWPVSAQVSSHFGWRRNPMGGRGGEFHSGIDIRAPRNTPIRAAGGGTVSFAGWRGGYGLVVMINHGSGVTTLYAHNSVNLVSVGQRIERGEIIARVGTTGRTTGPHVHFEVHINGTATDPWPFMMEHY